MAKLTILLNASVGNFRQNNKKIMNFYVLSITVLRDAGLTCCLYLYGLQRKEGTYETHCCI